MIERFTSEVRHRWRALFRRRELEAELEDELSFHLEQEAAKLVRRGVPAADAARQARVAFGGADRIREATRDVRGTRHLDALAQDVRHAVRQLGGDRGYTILVIATLALATGANAALFTLVDHLFVRAPEGVVKPQELLRLYRHRPPGEGTDGYATPGFPYPAVMNIAAALPDDHLLVTYGIGPWKLGLGEGAPERTTVRFGPGYFELLGVRAAMGRLPTEEEQRMDGGAAVALLSHDEWQSSYGADASVLGREVRLSKRPYTIIGVLPRGFTGVDVSAAAYWVPMEAYPSARDPYHLSWQYGGADVIVRADPESADRIAAIASGVVSRGAPEWFGDASVTVAPLKTALGPHEQRAELAVTTRLAAVAIILLLIACANIANVNLARAARRRQEIAIRLALGISRWRLVRMLTLETLLLSLMAALAALLVAFWGGSILRATLFPDVTWSGSPLDLRVALFALALGLAAGLLAGLPPALRAGRFGLTMALKAGARQGGSPRSHLRTALVGIQTGLSVILLVAAGAFIRSLQAATSIDVGFDADRLAVVTLAFDDRENHNADFAAIMPELAERLRAMPQVESVALSDSRPLENFTFGSLYDETGRELQFPRMPPTMQGVSPEFFRTMGMETLLMGRLFSDSDRDPAAPHIVVNRAMAAQLWPGESPLGRCLRLFAAERPCARVIGVVHNAHRDALIEPDPVPHFYASIDEAEKPRAHFVIIRAREGELDRTMAAARTIVRAGLPAGAFPDVRAMAEPFARELRPWRLGAALFSALGLLALVVAMVGTYSVISYLVNQRRHEMGVRMALGAGAAQLARMIITESLRMVGMGVLVGVAAALALGGLLDSLLYATSARDPRIIAVVMLLLVLTAAGAALGPAWRVTRVHPADALRSD